MMNARIWMTASAAVLTVAGVAHGQDGRFELRSDNMIARSDPFAPDEELLTPLGAPFDLETGFDSNTWARWVQPLEGRQVLRFEQQVRVRSYFDRGELDSILLTPRVQYWTTTADNSFQFRIYGAYSHLTRDGDTQWTRPETEAQVRWRPGGDTARETVARVRLNAYDFDDAALNGLDSTRVRYGLEQFFRNEDRSLELRLSAFLETADADLAAFSFEETRLGAEVAWQPNDKTLVIAGLDIRDRDYDAPLGGAFPDRRADERFTVNLRVEREVAARITAFAAAGYLDNASNISLRDYGGETFQVGFRIEI